MARARETRVPSAIMTLLVALVLTGILQGQAPTPLRIVVLEGEDAVNIVQQKTAVRPLVEVRDRNNLPVAGASVTFSIGSGQPAAFAGGARTITVTTNTAGQAAANGFNVIGEGAVRIQVQASHLGQVATATISQTAFATAAAAAAAGAGGSTAAGAAAGTAAGGTTAGATGTVAAAGGGGAGGGIYAVTIGVIGAGVAGGVVAATTVMGSEGGDSFDNFQGSFSGQMIFTSVSTSATGTTSCTWVRSVTGTMSMDLRTDFTGGNSNVAGTIVDVSVTGTCGLGSTFTFATAPIMATGGPAALAFTDARGVGSPNQMTLTFGGAYSPDSVTGTITLELRTESTTNTPTAQSTQRGSGTATVPVTLQRTTGSRP